MSESLSADGALHSSEEGLSQRSTKQLAEPQTHTAGGEEACSGRQSPSGPLYRKTKDTGNLWCYS